MALTLEALRSNIQDSIKGRKLGLNSAGYLQGPLALRSAIEDISSTTPTTTLAYGVTRILTSGSSQGPTQHFLPAPVPGVEKIIVLNSTSTGSQQFLSTANGASIFSATDGATKGVINFVGPGGGIRLLGVTTAIWAVIGSWGSTAASQPTYTTST